MQWMQIRKNHPNQFILLKDYKSELVDETHFRVLEGEVIQADENFGNIRRLYQEHRAQGVDVIYCLPTTQDFIVETSPMMGVLNAIR